MRNSSLDFKSELRISPNLVVVVLAISGMVLVFMSDMRPDRSSELRMMLIALLCYAMSMIILLLGRWKSIVGQWSAVIALAILVHLVSFWLGVPGFLALMMVPTALAATLISLSAAGVVAVGETLLLILRPEWVVTGASLSHITIPLIGVWMVLGVMWAVYRPVYQVTQWSWEYFQQARRLLEEARDRQLELSQTMDDLANANLQLTRLNILTQGLRQAAEDARTAKEQFVANVSHELRKPLNMIVGFSEMIVQSPETYGGQIPPALLADLVVIHRNAKHLSDLIDDVLDLSQLESSQMALTKEHVRFPEIVEAATVALRPLFESKALYLETEIPEDLPTVFCDRTRIREVLMNLLSNAGRFTERGGVRVCAWQKGDDIAVAVADTGPGIAAENMDKLFQPFQQLDGSIRRRYGGTGLGLSISKRFIELHGGKIWVESEEGVGTTFFFQIPIAPPAPMGSDFLRGLYPDWGYLQRTRPSKAPTPTVRPRFVVLDTGDSLQRLLIRYLGGVEVVPVTTMEEALDELLRVPSQALLVNSPSVSRTLERFSPSTTLPSGTPAIICSIPSKPEVSAVLGVSEHLVKPISREALLGALDRLNLERGTILIVDDEPDALHLLGRMLASSGREYRVLLARDGQEAMSILRECRPDVILLDLIMPNMDGFQLLEMRGQDPVLRGTPIIVVSARDPAGQPIVSSTLAVTQGGGLSTRQLLMGIEFISRVLSVAGQVGAPMRTEAVAD
jgi:signal transduction histidine kinase/CheY-like chemotaxis protein